MWSTSRNLWCLHVTPTWMPFSIYSHGFWTLAKETSRPTAKVETRKRRRKWIWIWWPGLWNLCISFAAFESVCVGIFSPQRVQQIAEQAVKDIERSKDDPRVLKDLYTLANLGAKGKYPNNIHSELMNKVEHVPQLPKPYAAKVPLKGFPDSVQHMLLPHEMFACIWESYKQVWNTAIVPSVERVRKFWRAMRQHPQLDGHPMTAHSDWDTTTIPFAVHGDGVPVTGIGKVWSRVMTNYSFYSLLGHGNTGSMLLWIWGFFDKLKVGDQTNGTLFEFYTVLK